MLSTHMHKLLLGVELPAATFPVAVGLIHYLRLLLALLFIALLFYQSHSIRLLLHKHMQQIGEGIWVNNENTFENTYKYYTNVYYCSMI